MTPQESAQIKRYVNAAVRRAMERDSPENVDSKRRDFYVYEAQTTAGTPIPFGGTDEDVINIEADSVFILEKLSFQADIAGAAFTDSTRVIPNVSVQLTDTGSGRQLMQNPIPIPSIFGWGELPFVLDHPRKFERNSTIQVAFANFDAAVAYNVRLAFIGYKIYGTS